MNEPELLAEIKPVRGVYFIHRKRYNFACPLLAKNNHVAKHSRRSVPRRTYVGVILPGASYLCRLAVKPIAPPFRKTKKSRNRGQASSLSAVLLADK